MGARSNLGKLHEKHSLSELGWLIYSRFNTVPNAAQYLLAVSEATMPGVVAEADALDNNTPKTEHQSEQPSGQPATPESPAGIVELDEARARRMANGAVNAAAVQSETEQNAVNDQVAAAMRAVDQAIQEAA